jgi:hypothetical protein
MGMLLKPFGEVDLTKSFFLLLWPVMVFNRELRIPLEDLDG